MSVVGVDLGSMNTVIGVVRNHGVDVIVNEVSNRTTPSIVVFGAKNRFIGESAKTQETANLKNTVCALTRLAGRSFDDVDVQIEQEFVSAKLVNAGREVGAEVTYLGETKCFSATELIAMFLTKVKSTVAVETNRPVDNIVLSCPFWYTDGQRRSIIDACDIVGLKCVRLMNDTTASALGYGLTKANLIGPDEKFKRVAFIDIGYSNYSCSIVEFKSGSLTVKSTVCDRHFGGRNFDRAMLDYFTKEFKEKHNLDISGHPKACFRVASACEKLKKVLSTNTMAPISVESLVDDRDMRAMLKRSEFVEIIKPYLERLTEPIKKALAEANLKPGDIDSIELVGGTTRVPDVTSIIEKFFGKKTSSFLNRDEAVARGCSFCCAILSPVFRVRDFEINDIVSYPIEFAWQEDPDIPDEHTNLVVFKKGNAMPWSKLLTFYRKQPFELEARYANPDIMPGNINPHIGRIFVDGVKAEGNDFMICKLKTRMNRHGLLIVEAAYSVEDQEIEEPIPESKDAEKPSQQTEKKDGDAMDTNETEKPKTRKVKKQVRTGNLSLAVNMLGMEQKLIEGACFNENQMSLRDKSVIDTEDKKNELESHVYELKQMIDNEYAKYANETEKTKLKDKLEQIGEWLYSGDENATMEEYVAKFEEIHVLSGPIIQRYMDVINAEKERQANIAAMKRAEEMQKVKEKEEKEKEKEEEKKASESEKKDDVEMTEASGSGVNGVAEPESKG